MMMRVWMFAPLALLIGCGPIPVQQAERACLERARLAQKPEASIFLGVNNRGDVLKGASFGVSTDYLAGRDPSAVFNECVKSRSGQFPTRSFTEFPPAR